MASPLHDALSRPKIPKLDALRGISALFVVLYHSGFDRSPAGFGVLCFFVISGFLITWLLLRENADTGDVSLRNFYARRALRIFPAFYAYFAIALASLLLAHIHIIWPQVVCAFFYVANYYQGLHHYPSSLFSHTWSLAIEEQFYLLWPAAFVLLRRRPRLLAGTLTAAILSIWCYRTVAHLLGTPEAYIYTAFEMRADHLLIGCLLAVCTFHRLFLGPVDFVARRSWLIVPILIALVASLGAAHRWGADYRNTVGYAAEPVLVAALMIALIPLNGRGVAWMDHPWVSYIGRISYSTYLYQQLVIPLVGRVLHRAGIESVGIHAALAVLATWGVAALSYQFVEIPFLRLKRRFGSRTTPEAAAPSVPAAPAPGAATA